MGRRADGSKSAYEVREQGGIDVRDRDFAAGVEATGLDPRLFLQRRVETEKKDEETGEFAFARHERELGR